MMNIELFIARRLFFDKKNYNNISKQIINIALASIALSLVAMIIAVSVVTGFKEEVSNKVIGFGGHLQVVNFDSNYSFENQPINKNQPFLKKLKSLGVIKNIQVFATKSGIIKTEENIEGIVLKGVGSDYHWDFFKNYLVSGKVPIINDTLRVNEILISEHTAKLLQFDIGDNVYIYFISNESQTIKPRQFKISGIYNTGLAEFDKLFIIADIKHIQLLNRWNKNQISGFEINLNNFDQLIDAEYQVRELVVNYTKENSAILRTENIVRKYPQIFDWLSILDMNVWVILVLMTLVAGINMISALLVLILERGKMIGVLKSLGSPNWSIRKVFLYLSGFLVSRGLLWGNLIGISFILIQKYLKILTLDPTSYYVSFVPVNFSITYLLFLNLGTMIIVLFMLIIPSYYISKLSPEKTIRFN